MERCGVRRKVRLLEPTGGSSGLFFGCCRNLWRVRLFVEVSVSVPLRGGPDPEVSLLSFVCVAVGCGRAGVRGGLFLDVWVAVSMLRGNGGDVRRTSILGGSGWSGLSVTWML